MLYQLSYGAIFKLDKSLAINSSGTVNHLLDNAAHFNSVGQQVITTIHIMTGRTCIVRLLPGGLVVFKTAGLSHSPNCPQQRVNGPSDRIRTCDLTLPKRALYQTELHSVMDPGTGLEPVLAEPKSAVLPIRRSRNQYTQQHSLVEPARSTLLYWQDLHYRPVVLLGISLQSYSVKKPNFSR